MVAGLGTITSLRDISIGILSPVSRPNPIRLPLISWTILPTQTPISSPRCSRLTSILRTSQLEMMPLDSTQSRYVASISLFTLKCGKCPNFPSSSITQESQVAYYGLLRRVSFCEGIDWQVSQLTQIYAVFSNTVKFTVHRFLAGTTGVHRRR